MMFFIRAAGVILLFALGSTPHVQASHGSTALKNPPSIKRQSKQPHHKSLPAQPVDVLVPEPAFDAHAFRTAPQTAPTLYVGMKTASNDETIGTYALARAQITPSDMERLNVTLTPLAGNALVIGQGPSGPSILQKKAIATMTLLNDAFPVVTTRETNNSNNPSNKIYVVNVPENPSNTLESDALHDANNDIASGSRGLAATLLDSSSGTGQVFTAVAAKDHNFGSYLETTGQVATTDGQKRGIAVLLYQTSVEGPQHATITQSNAYDFLDQSAYARELSLETNTEAFIAFNDAIINDALIGDQVAIWWDDTLKCLYIGLSDVHRADPTQEGGITTLLMGQFAANDPAQPGVVTEFVLNPFVRPQPTTTLFTSNQTNHIVGYYADANTEDTLMSTRLIRTLHTSTSKHYVILHTIVSPPPVVSNNLLIPRTRSWVYALPVCGPSDTPSNLTGALAKINNNNNIGNAEKTAPEEANLPSSADQMPAEDFTALRVGRPMDGPYGPWLESTWLTDLFVQGDAVYASFAGPDNQHAGLFMSTALFNKDGFIFSWTPWQRIGGEVHRAHAVGIDSNTADLYQLCPASHTDPAHLFDQTTIRTTDWGRTDLVYSTTEPHNLSDAFDQLLPLTQCGCSKVVCFDEFTPGFVPQQFGMLIGLGFDNLLIAQTGLFENGGLQPIAVYNDAKTIHDYGRRQEVGQAGAALTTIAPLTCAEVDRTTLAAGGWLFVGGKKGLVCLCNTTGNGWNANVGLGDLTTASWPGENFTFKQLQPNAGSFADIKALKAVKERLYILTSKALYSLDLNAMLATTLATANPIVTVTEVVRANKDQQFVDIVITPDESSTTVKWGVLASSSGLFVVNIQTPHSPLYEVKVNGGSLGPVAPLQYLSQTRGIPSSKGNLYTLHSSLAYDTARLYRFYLDGNAASAAGVVASIALADGTQGPLVDFKRRRYQFFTDGATVLHGMSRDANLTDYVDLMTLPNTDSAAEQNITPLLDIDINRQTLLSPLTREGVFGAWLVPGVWGLRVNQ